MCPPLGWPLGGKADLAEPVAQTKCPTGGPLVDLVLIFGLTQVRRNFPTLSCALVLGRVGALGGGEHHGGALDDYQSVFRSLISDHALAVGRAASLAHGVIARRKYFVGRSSEGKHQDIG